MRPSEGRLQLWPVAIAAMMLVVALLSFDVPLRLNHDPPQQYRNIQLAPGRAANPELADQYWVLAVQVIQWKYPFGTALPQNPLPEFTATPDIIARDRSAAGSRQQYWNLLRQLWSRPEVWHRTLEFDIGWVVRALESVTDFVSSLVRH